MCRFPCEGRMASSTLAGCIAIVAKQFGLPTGCGPVTSTHGYRVRLLSGLLNNRRHGTQMAERRSSNLRACGFESHPCYSGDRTMKNDRQFTIRLANGKEHSCNEASAMVEWLDRQRGLEYHRKRCRPKTSHRDRCPQRTPESSTIEAPLARYANRHSGEA